VNQPLLRLLAAHRGRGDARKRVRDACPSRPEDGSSRGRERANRARRVPRAAHIGPTRRGIMPQWPGEEGGDHEGISAETRLPFIAGSRRLPPGVMVGRHTYGHDRHSFPMFTEDARIVVGSFCSISPEVRILGGGEHVTTRASTFPLNARFFDPAKRNSLDAIDQGPTVIGNDVWIGYGATVLSGVTVGHGAVLGARAVVSQSVPPYAVVVGNPARIVSYRFAADVRNRLLALRWWDWDDEVIPAASPGSWQTSDRSLMGWSVWPSRRASAR
jgi:acetyltransferase-like isoleucine patch superfamily enzyme